MRAEMSFIFFAIAFSGAVFMPLASAGVAVPAIYVFGDSTVDVGNNNFLPGNQAKAIFPHNGIDFPGGTPTGRFSNGFNGVDYLARKLRLHKSPPAYLSVSSDAAASRGVNFASGGSGILDATGRNVSVSLNQQIKDYQNIRQSLKSQIGSASADRFLSKSLFIFSTGNNDLFGFFSLFGLKNTTQQDLFIGQLAYEFKSQLQALYSLGARKFVVFGSSKLGCVPTLRRNVLTGGCVEDMNNLSQKFNGATQSVLSTLASELNGFSYSFIDVYDVVSTISSNPQKYGFTNIDSACCGAGRFNAESACTPNATYCSDRSQYFFWDRLHPTQATSKLIANAAFHGRKYTTPVTVKQLALHRKGY